MMQVAHSYVLVRVCMMRDVRVSSLLSHTREVPVKAT